MSNYKQNLKIIKIIFDKSSEKERNQLLAEIVAYTGKKNEININKLTNGALSENIICDQLGLTLNKINLHGFDCFNKNNQPVELKSFTTNKRININYKLPAKKKTQSQQEYYLLIEEFIKKNTGGHIWVALNNKKTNIVQYFVINSENFSKAFVKKCKEFYEKKKNNPISINFGCLKCKNCGELHKIENLVESINKKSEIPNKISWDC